MTEFFEVTLANGKKVVAYDCPKGYVKDCLVGTNATFKETTKENAQKINYYFHANGGDGWEALRRHALEAYLESNKSNELKSSKKIKISNQDNWEVLSTETMEPYMEGYESRNITEPEKHVTDPESKLRLKIKKML